MAGPGFLNLGMEEKSLITQVMDSGALTRYMFADPENDSLVRRLEKSFCDKFAVPYAVAVNSGTSALVTALAGLGIGAGDEVIVPGYTYVASIGAIAHLGAVPVLAEIDPSLTLCVSDVMEKITEKTKAIMPVHMLGNPCNMSELLALARQHNIMVIEDAAQACGGSYHGQRLGTLGDAGIFSFNPFKVMTTGEGGLAIFKAYEHYYRGYAFEDQGWPPGRELGNEPVDYIPGFGLNLRMCELNAAIGLPQLAKIDDIISQVRRIQTRLRERIELVEGIWFAPQYDPAGNTANVLLMQCASAELAQNFARELGSKTLDDSGRHYYANLRPLGRQRRIGLLPRTDYLLQRSIAISVGVSDAHLGSGYGVFPNSTDAEIDAVAAQINRSISTIFSAKALHDSVMVTP